MSTNPFTDPRLIAEHLYTSPARLAARSGTLHAAKISGHDATTTIVELAARQTAASTPVICDIGCGRGTTTLALATALPTARLIAVDQSQPLLDTVTQRLHRAEHRVETICADFHDLPLPQGTVDPAVAAFCLYHSAQPAQVIDQIAAILPPGGHAVLATNPRTATPRSTRCSPPAAWTRHATARPSLHQTFHSANAAEIVSSALEVTDIVHQQHVFRFADLDQLAAYIATSPKYTLSFHGDAEQVADELRRRIPDAALVATSTFTYITATRR
ncbi:class I SAM-dependent methyltransferase [Nocardia brasiliensis]|uniref:class I SAM-dependent methyltransferase n=1 Tax=Nocardia brasiliensis TaxID=37326 RepID=UPI0037B2F9D5